MQIERERDWNMEYTQNEPNALTNFYKEHRNYCQMPANPYLCVAAAATCICARFIEFLSHHTPQRMKECLNICEQCEKRSFSKQLFMYAFYVQIKMVKLLTLTLLRLSLSVFHFFLLSIIRFHILRDFVVVAFAVVVSA